MVRYARESQRDPAIRLFAETLIQNISPKDYLSEMLAIYYAILKYTRYASDPRTVELVKRPELVVKQIAAGQVPSIDCDDMSVLQAALLMSLGREVRYVTAAFANNFHGNERQFSHIYVQAREPRSNQWVTLDPVAAEEVGQMLSRIKALKIWPIA